MVWSAPVSTSKVPSWPLIRNERCVERLIDFDRWFTLRNWCIVRMGLTVCLPLLFCRQIFSKCPARLQKLQLNYRYRQSTREWPVDPHDWHGSFVGLEKRLFADWGRVPTGFLVWTFAIGMSEEWVTGVWKWRTSCCRRSATWMIFSAFSKSGLALSKELGGSSDWSFQRRTCREVLDLVISSSEPTWWNHSAEVCRRARSSIPRMADRASGSRSRSRMWKSLYFWYHRSGSLTIRWDWRTSICHLSAS